jgi:hypothetical protein
MYEAPQTNNVLNILFQEDISETQVSSSLFQERMVPSARHV